ncbi:MAG: branched-chain amino acid ABC transporter ATP-binding protein/permease [Candidatus Marinimicrobia bacterium]|nr:branched-chain amino acid ABC transporter ATP-binding protein/permease [Candidatus Neomarinimicrobiota bacterium]
MATLAATIVIHAVMVNSWGRLGGPDGFGGITPWGQVLPLGGTPRRADFLVSFLIVITVWLMLRNLRRSRFWRAWIALGDDEVAAVSCGISPPRLVLLAFVLSGFLIGVAGGAYAHVQRYIAPGNFGLMESVMIVSAVMLGGRGGLAGPPMAAAVVWLLPEQLQIAPYARLLIFGIALLALLRLRSQGLLPQRPLAYARTNHPSDRADDRKMNIELTAHELRYSIGAFEPVSDVSLTVCSGEGIGLVGRNGSGKTLTLDMLSGFLKPSSGMVKLGERRIEGLEPWHVARTGIRRTFQESRLFQRLSVLEHAMVGSHTCGRVSIFAAVLGLHSARLEQGKIVTRGRTMLVLFGEDRFGPRENDPAVTFSFGNRRRIEMARCLAAEPLRVLVLDEPFVGVPHDDIPALCSMLRREAQLACIVVAEHDIEALYGLVDSLLRLEQGKVVSEAHSDKTEGGRTA